MASSSPQPPKLTLTYQCPYLITHLPTSSYFSLSPPPSLHVFPAQVSGKVTPRIGTRQLILMLLLAVRKRIESLTSLYYASSVPDCRHFPPFQFQFPPPSPPAPFEVAPPFTPPSCSPRPPLRPRRHRHRREANFFEALITTKPVDATPQTHPRFPQDLSLRVKSPDIL